MVDAQYQPRESGSTPEELALAAEEYRRALASTVQEFRSSIAPAPLARATGDAVLDTIEKGATRVEGKTWVLLTGAVAAAALLSGAIWRKRAAPSVASTPSGPSSTESSAYTAAAAPGVHGAGHAPLPDAHQSRRKPAAVLSNLLDLAPKVSAGIAIGFVVDRYLPRVDGEEEIWRDARTAIGQKWDGIVTRELRARAEQPGNLLPYLGVIATIIQAFNKRNERSSLPD